MPSTSSVSTAESRAKLIEQIGPIRDSERGIIQALYCDDIQVQIRALKLLPGEIQKVGPHTVVSVGALLRNSTDREIQKLAVKSLLVLPHGVHELPQVVDRLGDYSSLIPDIIGAIWLRKDGQTVSGIGDSFATAIRSDPRTHEEIRANLTGMTEIVRLSQSEALALAMVELWEDKAKCLEQLLDVITGLPAKITILSSLVLNLPDTTCQRLALTELVRMSDCQEKRTAVDNVLAVVLAEGREILDAKIAGEILYSLGELSSTRVSQLLELAKRGLIEPTAVAVTLNRKIPADCTPALCELMAIAKDEADAVCIRSFLRASRNEINLKDIELALKQNKPNEINSTQRLFFLEHLGNRWENHHDERLQIEALLENEIEFGSRKSSRVAREVWNGLSARPFNPWISFLLFIDKMIDLVW